MSGTPENQKSFRCFWTRWYCWRWVAGSCCGGRLTNGELHSGPQRLGQSRHRGQAVHTRAGRRSQAQAAAGGEVAAICPSSADVVVARLHLRRAETGSVGPRRSPEASRRLLTSLLLTCQLRCGRGNHPAAWHWNSAGWPLNTSRSSPRISTPPFSANTGEHAQTGQEVVSPARLVHVLGCLCLSARASVWSASG